MDRKTEMAQTGAAPAFALDEWFTLRNRDEVLRFLNEHPYLVPVLEEAREQIPKYFPDTPMVLEVVVDPEVDDWEELFLSISTDLPQPVARERMERFDREWWFPASDRAKNMLCIMPGFR